MLSPAEVAFYDKNSQLSPSFELDDTVITKITNEIIAGSSDLP